ncbi:MAG: hypothetical protein CVT94_00830 [Bacteroidetes bacterium HGW-Bacteroidetes-11]|nr:MAG: hypothetical protein CVT94_00830 [Bacteroidetes bacterium HGW-Bacteroidetes-11]
MKSEKILQDYSDGNKVQNATNSEGSPDHVNKHLNANYLYLCSILVLLKTLTLLFKWISAELFYSPLIAVN